MKDTRPRKYYRAYYRGNRRGSRWLMDGFLTVDSRLREVLNVGGECGLVTFVTCLMIVVLTVCLVIGLRTMNSKEKVFEDAQRDVDKKIPRRKSIAGIRPAYNCIHKHLQQTNVFQEKTKKMLCKEHLELEILNSRMNCINKLLKPEAQAERRGARSKVSHRPVNVTGE